MAISTSPVHQATSITTSVTITAAASGNTLIACVASYRSSGARTVSSIACTNVSWVVVKAATLSSSDAEIWVGSVAGGSSGTTVTFTMSGTQQNVAINVSEWSGVLTPSSSAADGTASFAGGTTANGSAQAFNSYNNEANDLVIAAVAVTASSTLATLTGLTALTTSANSTNCSMAAGYLVPAAANGCGSLRSTATNGLTYSYVLVGFKVSPQTQAVTAVAFTGLAAWAPSFTDRLPQRGVNFTTPATASPAVAFSKMPEKLSVEFTDGTPVFVRESTGTTTAVTLSAAAASGNVLLVALTSFLSPAFRTVSSISCTNTTGWGKVSGVTITATTELEIWAGYATGTTGTALSITMSASGAAVAVDVLEVQGLTIPPTGFVTTPASVVTGAGLSGIITGDTSNINDFLLMVSASTGTNSPTLTALNTGAPTISNLTLVTNTAGIRCGYGTMTVKGNPNNINYSTNYGISSTFTLAVVLFPPVTTLGSASFAAPSAGLLSVRTHASLLTAALWPFTQASQSMNSQLSHSSSKTLTAQPVAIEFTPPSSYYLQSVALWLSKSGLPGNASVSVRTASGTAISATDIELVSSSVNSLPAGFSAMTFTFSGNTILTGGTGYAIIISVPGISGPNSLDIGLAIGAGGTGNEFDWSGSDWVWSSTFSLYYNIICRQSTASFGGALNNLTGRVLASVSAALSAALATLYQAGGAGIQHLQDLPAATLAAGASLIKQARKFFTGS